MKKHDLQISPIRLFADDIKMYRVVNNLRDALIFQSYLDSISSWCDNSQLSINVDKCCVIHLGKTNDNFLYCLNGCKLPSPDLIKDLGVYIDSSLTYSKHIDIICAKARARCALFLKTFISRNPFTMKLFFTSYVRPLLEFSSPVWNPISKSDINKLESVQRYFTNRIPTCTYLPYNCRLKNLGLDSLEKRRTVADLVCLFSIISGSLNTFLHPHLLFDNPSTTRSHNLRLTTPLFNLSASQQNFISRTAPVWNKLPITILAASSKFIFRKRLSYVLADPISQPV